jgi:indole-3-glycerol phosphate synthase
MGFLTDLVDRLRQDLREHPLDDATLMARAAAMPPTRNFEGALRGSTPPALIAEVKRASPSAGAIAKDANASVVSIPVLRKDFVVHPAQVIESRASGADAVLLIAAVLTDAELRALLEAATDLGLGTLLETHSDEDLRRALATDAPVIGVNARDLETLDVDVEGALARLEGLPADRLGVLESGVSTRGHVDAALAAGASAILVGETLMRAEDPARAVRKLLWRELRT